MACYFLMGVARMLAKCSVLGSKVCSLGYVVLFYSFF